MKRLSRLLLLTAALFLSIVSIAYAHGDADDGPHEVPGIGMKLPDFSLIRANKDGGKPFTRADLGTRPSLFFFGFTHCPDVCPAALIDMSAFLEKLGPEEAKKINMVFVTVDPGRDNVGRMTEFVSQFDVNSRLIPLTGSRIAIRKLTDAAHVYVEKVEAGEKGNDTGKRQVNHTASIYLYDGTGTFTGTISTGENRDIGFQKVKKLIADNPEQTPEKPAEKSTEKPAETP